jgi:hypothetical protein
MPYGKYIHSGFRPPSAYLLHRFLSHILLDFPFLGIIVTLLDHVTFTAELCRYEVNALVERWVRALVAVKG